MQVTQAIETMERSMSHVAIVYTMEALVPGGHPVLHVSLLRPLPAGTKLYLGEGIELDPNIDGIASSDAIDHGYDSAERDAARFRWLCDHLSRDEFIVPQGADPYRYMADHIDLHREIVEP